ncbi:DUF2057 domain-containing protein [Vibrio mexicanus]|uniref:YccT family protein n=1 Tax=Vibrio mexicanus TaxID=1004326 RepID=UPI000ABFEDBF|nr:DUF2057 domain-containing protein [Vibrio mexicanus]
MKYLVLVCLSVISLGSMANQLTVERGVEVLVVNGLKVGEEKAYQINQGFNQVVVRMSKRLTKGSSREYFTSKPFVIDFDTTKDAVINHPQVINYSDAEKKFRHSPKWIVKSDGKLLVHNSALLPGREGFMPYAQIEDIIAEYNYAQNIVLSADSETPAGKLKLAEKAKHEETVEQLKLWYSRADEEQRAEFQHWMTLQ